MRILPFIALTALTGSVLACSLSYRAASSPDRRLSRPQAVRQTPFVQRDILVNGLRVRYLDEGAGPPVLLIPGLASRIEEFDRLAADLLPRFRVLALDLPGSGYSDKPDREYDLVFYEDSVLGFLDELGIEKCFLVGGSLGGNLALRLAHRAPERFPRVAVWSPGSSWEPRPCLAAVMRLFGGRTLFWPTIKVQSAFWHSDDWPDQEANFREAVAYFEEVMSPGFVRMYWDLAAEQVGWSLQSIAGGIETPTLLMWGDQDDGLGMDAGVARLSELMPHVEFLTFPGAGHNLAVERPDELTRRTIEFFERPADRLP